MSTNKSAPPSSNANIRKQEKLERLIARFKKQEELSCEDVAYIRWCSDFFSFNDLTMPKVRIALRLFRSAHEKKIQKRLQKAEKLSTAAPAYTRKERKQTPEQRERSQLRAEAMDAYVDWLTPACSPEWIAREQTSDIFFDAYHEWIEELHTETVQALAHSLADKELAEREKQAALSAPPTRKKGKKGRAYVAPSLRKIPFVRSITDRELNRLEERFIQRLDAFQEHTIEQFQKQSKIRTFWAYYEGAFKKQWEALTQEHRLRCLEHGFDIESLIQFSQDEALQYANAYQGLWSVASAREDLKDLLDQFEAAVERRFAEEEQFQRLVSLYEAHSDFASCFPVARGLKRQIEFFCGPTNSGKTHAAMNELASSESGVYLAPLRLLALEGQENLLSRGVRASYLTGEERNVMEGATFVSSTIEMLDYEEPVDTAIIDEIQMIGDAQRGWAWTNALVGVPAKRVLLTGSIDALPLIQKIADFLGEELIVRRFERFNSLEVMKRTSSVEFEDIERLEVGTAIVCFSRRDVLELKQHIESATQMGVSVIYGGLAPEVRREEARRFREREADILVATDAISMGLNLPVRTVLFWRTWKRYGGQTHPLRDTEIKQIAGRAGRFGFEDRGFVGAFDEDDLQRVHEALNAELAPVEGPCLVMPLPLHIRLIAEALHTDDLVYILRYFCERIWFSKEHFFPVVTEDMLMLARMLEESAPDLSLFDKYTFACAPVNMRATGVVQAHLSFAVQFAKGEDIELPTIAHKHFRKGAANSPYQLREAEDSVLIATLYQWLGYRFPDAFVSMDEAREIRDTINRYIARSLERGRLAKTCSRCHTRLPSGFRFNICESCFSSRKNPRTHKKSRPRSRSTSRSRSRSR